MLIPMFQQRGLPLHPGIAANSKAHGIDDLPVSSKMKVNNYINTNKVLSSVPPAKPGLSRNLIKNLAKNDAIWKHKVGQPNKLPLQIANSLVSLADICFWSFCASMKLPGFSLVVACRHTHTILFDHLFLFTLYLSSIFHYLFLFPITVFI